LDYFRDKATSAANCDRESKQRFNERPNFSTKLVLRSKANRSRMHFQLEDPMRSWVLQKKTDFGRTRRSHWAKMSAAARQIPSEIQPESTEQPAALNE
jgi:hypothetical protein